MENENQDPQQNQNNAPPAGDLAAITTQLADEKAARAAAEGIVAEKDTCITERDARIAALENSLSEAKQQSEAKDTQLTASAAELASTRAAKDAAVVKYLGMAKALNPAVPEHVIRGTTVEEIDASIAEGNTIVEAVKKAMEANAARAKVPAGAPARGGINLEGMSPREKIAYGIQQKGGA